MFVQACALIMCIAPWSLGVQGTIVVRDVSDTCVSREIFFSPPHLPLTTVHLYQMLQMFLRIFHYIFSQYNLPSWSNTLYFQVHYDDTACICGNYCVFAGFQQTCVHYSDFIFNPSRNFSDTSHSKFRLHNTNWPLCSSCILQTSESLHQTYAYLQFCHAGVWPIHTHLCRWRWPFAHAHLSSGHLSWKSLFEMPWLLDCSLKCFFTISCWFVRWSRSSLFMAYPTVHTRRVDDLWIAFVPIGRKERSDFIRLIYRCRLLHF